MSSPDSQVPTAIRPAWESQLSATDRWNLVNYLRSNNGQRPTANPSASAAGPADRVAFLFPVGFALFVGSWLIAGLRRSRGWKRA